MKETSESSSADRGFALLLLVVVLVRLSLLFTSQYHANGDDAAIGVMGQKILQGDRPLHPSMADQHAGSAVAGYVAAGTFAVLGISEPALKVPPLLWSLLALVSLYVLVRATRGAEAALLVAALYASSVGLMKWSFYSAGGYIACQALFSIALWFLLARVTTAERARPRHDALLGLLCGLGTANLVLFAPAAATAGIFVILAGATRPLWARVSRFAAGLALGCAPLALFGRSVEQDAPHTFLDRLGALPESLWQTVTRHLPAMMAYDNVEGTPPLRLVPNGVAYAALLFGFALLIALRGPALASYPRRVGSGGWPVPLEAPVLIYSVLYLLLYAVHPLAGTEARYLLPLEPSLSILAGLGLHEAMSRARNSPVLGWTAGALAAIAIANGAVQYVRLFGDDSVRGARGPVDPKTAPAVAAFLDQLVVRYVVTDDWDLAWRMSFHTRGRIVGCHAVSDQRAWLARRDGRRTWRYAVVVRAGSHRDRVLEQRVARAGLPAERHVVLDRAVHVLGRPGGTAEVPEGWCPADRMMEPVSLERARAAR
jgi:4-amino-4-deoxy-L-arabinose transferase-like glycosyltransferase